jgi:hypothetical protein
MKKTKPRITIVIQGGTLQDVACDQPIDITVVDWDNIKEGGETEPYDGSNYAATITTRNKFDIYISKLIAEVNEIIQRNVAAEKESE